MCVCVYAQVELRGYIGACWCIPATCTRVLRIHTMYLEMSMCICVLVCVCMRTLNSEAEEVHTEAGGVHIIYIHVYMYFNICKYIFTLLHICIYFHIHI